MRAARGEKAPVHDSSVTAYVTIACKADGFFPLSTVFEGLVPGRDRAEIEEFAWIVHQRICPYSRVTRSNVDVTVRVV